MADVADMKRQPERRAANRLRIQKHRRFQMIVPLRACPDIADGHHMNEIPRGNKRLPNIVADIAGNTAHPGIYSVQPLDIRFQPKIRDKLTDKPRLILNGFHIIVRYDYRSGIKTIPGSIALNRRNRVPYLIPVIESVFINVRSVLITVDHFLKHCHKTFHFRRPAPFSGIQLRKSVVFTEAEESGHPPVREINSIQLVEQPKNSIPAIFDGNNDTKVFLPKTGLNPSVERRIIKILIQQHRLLGEMDRPRPVRDSGMYISQKFVRRQISRRYLPNGETGEDFIRDLKKRVDSVFLRYLLTLAPLDNYVFHALF